MKTRNSFEIRMGKHRAKRSLVKLRRKWGKKDVIYRRGVCCKGKRWMELTQDRLL